MNGQPMGHGSMVYHDGSRIDGTFWGLDHHVGSGVHQYRTATVRERLPATHIITVVR